MGLEGAVFFLGVAVLIAATIYGAVSSKRTFLLAAAVLGAAGLAALGCYYAAVETRSVAWAIGFGVVGVGSLDVAVRQLLGRHSTSGS